MITKHRGQIAGAMLALALLAVPAEFRAAKTITLSSAFNIYTVTLDRDTIELGRGETVTVNADVIPRDQYIDFYVVGGADSRIDVSVGGVNIDTGRRTITIRDLTSPEDGSPNSPATIVIRARLPDNTNAVTPLGERIENLLNLVKEHWEEIWEPLGNPEGLVQQQINTMPTECGGWVKSGAISKLNLTALAEGETLPNGYPNLFGEAIKNSLQPVVCDPLGELMGAELKKQVINYQPVFEIKKKVPRNSKQVIVNAVNTTFEMKPSFTGWQLFVRDPDVPALGTYTVSEFIQKRPFSFLPVEPVSVSGTAAINATLKTGNIKITGSAAWKIHNDFGGHGFTDDDRYTTTIEVRW